MGNVANVVGSQVALLLPTLPFGGAFGAGARALTNLPKLGRFINPKTAQWAMQNAASSFGEGAVEGGNYIENAIMRGEDPEVARQKAWDVAKNNVAFLSGTNALEGGLAASIFNNKNSWKNRLASAAANALIQTYEEGGQRGIQLDAEGKPATLNPIEMMTNPKYAEQYKEMKETIAPLSAMGLGGFLLGSVGGRNQNNNPPPSQDEETTIQTSPSNTSNNLIDWVYNTSVYGDNDFVSKGKDATINKIIAEAQRQGVDPKLALTIGMIESHLNQSDGSNAGAIGVMQLMPETARGLGVDPYDEDQNIHGGVKFLKQMLDRFNGNVQLAVAAYNAGPGAVEQYGGIPPYGETQRYAKMVSRMYGNSSQATTSRTQPAQQQGNSLKITPQTGKECTLSAMSAIYNAYTGENTTSDDWGFSGANWWYSNLTNGKLQAKEYNFSKNERTQFEQTIKDHFDQNPNKPIFLYQAGGDGSTGNHKLNRVSGTHATVIGRRLANGKYQVFDSNGGKTHELSLSEIFDPTANGGDKLSGMNVGEGNNLWIPTIEPTKNITQWQNSTSSSGQTSKRNTTATQNDPNFTTRQNAVWREALWVADEAKKRYGYDLNPGWIFAQWRQETGENFDAGTGRMDNIGGLRDYNTGKMIDFTQRGGLHGYAEHFLTGFLKQRPELKNAKTAEDYWRIMWETHYFGNYPDPNNDNPYGYRDTIVKYQNWHPNTQGYSESDKDISDSEETETDSEQPQIERDTSNDALIRSLLEPTPTPT